MVERARQADVMVVLDGDLQFIGPAYVPGLQAPRFRPGWRRVFFHTDKLMPRLAGNAWLSNCKVGVWDFAVIVYDQTRWSYNQSDRGWGPSFRAQSYRAEPKRIMAPRARS